MFWKATDRVSLLNYRWSESDLKRLSYEEITKSKSLLSLGVGERFAVEEWILSGLKVHTIRDHPNHDRPLNGGLWGGVKGAVPGMARKVSEFANKGSYGGDLQFLNTVVWPLVKNSQLGHDAYTCQKWPNTRPFPTQRPANYQHVGQVFFADETFRVGDINGFMRGREIPRVCRKHPDWKFG